MSAPPAILSLMEGFSFCGRPAAAAVVRVGV